jgi:hypothetical protein
MEVMTPFLMGVGAIVGAIIGLKVFFTLWRILEKRLHPENFIKPSSTPETAFRGLKGKTIIIHMKSGEVISDVKYKATLFFGDGEFVTCTLVYFDMERSDGTHVFICGSDIQKIETTKRA